MNGDKRSGQERPAWKDAVERALRTGDFEDFTRAKIDGSTVALVKWLQECEERTEEMDRCIATVMYGENNRNARYAVMLALTGRQLGPPALQGDGPRKDEADKDAPYTSWEVLASISAIDTHRPVPNAGHENSKDAPPKWMNAIDEALKAGKVPDGIGKTAERVVRSLLGGADRDTDPDLDGAIDKVIYDGASTREDRYAVISAIAIRQLDPDRSANKEGSQESEEEWRKRILGLGGDGQASGRSK